MFFYWGACTEFTLVLAFTLVLLGRALDKNGLCPCVMLLSSRLTAPPLKYRTTTVMHSHARPENEHTDTDTHLH